MKFHSVWEGFVAYSFGLANYFFHPILPQIITPVWRKSLRAIDSIDSIDIIDLIDSRLGGKGREVSGLKSIAPDPTPSHNPSTHITKQIKI